MGQPIWNQINQRWNQWKTIQQSLANNKQILLREIAEPQKTPFAASLLSNERKSCLYITWNAVKANKVYQQFHQLYPNKTYLFKEKPIMLYDAQAKSSEADMNRLQVLNQLAQEEPIIVIASIESLFAQLTPPEVFRSETMVIDTTMQMERDALVAQLIESGYEHVTEVIASGQMSVRGGLLDIYPAGNDTPVRIEFFDDEIDSLRQFDADTQRSQDHIERVTIGPAHEVMVKERCFEDGITRLKEAIQAHEASGHYQRAIDRALMFIDQANRAKLGDYAAFFYPKHTTLFDYLPTQTVVIVDEPTKIDEKEKTWRQEFADYFSHVLEQGDVLPEQAQNWVDYATIQEKLEKKSFIMFQGLASSLPKLAFDQQIKLQSRETPTYRGNTDLLVNDIKRWTQEGYLTVVLTRNNGQKDQIMQLITEQQCKLASSVDQQANGVIVMSGDLYVGFIFDGAKTVVLTDYEIKGQTKKKVKRQKRNKFDPFTDLKVGDYVVHESHGIGQYIKIETLEVSGLKKDYIHIKYRGTDKLYVPIDQLELIQPYIGMDDKKPKLSSLGGNEWEKAKQKTQQSVKQLAFDLVKLYAEREARKGHQYAPDTQWQKEFEEAFPFEETPDQLQAIAEIKADMESDKVMDRLLCGDVGYGKTEVAIRAAFKAVMDGKQVAILAPTTVLVQQHLKTIKARFDQFPVSVNSISRFKSSAQQKETLRNVKAGNVDVLIGTHRILGKDIKFKDLGLLIVDEEQRFGVNHKETIKNMKNSIDVLTLSATPIPRTLHMSLVGIRDISTIQTPPQERIPVQTYVAEYSDALMRDVILRELGRGGQVFFLYNRVKSMERMASTLRQLVPNAKIIMAHGQMSGHMLEKTMLSFSEGEHDVLICSTIIENGIDISNVNTLIVHDADKFGLSQLYQLRGRVGRSNRAAYAYFTYDGQKMLTETAEKRLKAIKEFTEFGAGFKIAMRDLEIRGSGNIIGPEQHGHMSAVGYEMYCKLLEESVRELQGKPKKVQQKVETNVDLSIDAHIDEQYILDEKFRMDIYRKIAAIESEEDKMDIQDELIDRFGEYPTKTGYLLDIAMLRIMASSLMISDIVQRDKTIMIDFKKKPHSKKIMKAMNENRNVFYYSSQRMKGEIRLKSTLPGPAIRTLTKILKTLS